MAGITYGAVERQRDARVLRGGDVQHVVARGHRVDQQIERAVRVQVDRVLERAEVVEHAVGRVAVGVQHVVAGGDRVDDRRSPSS